MTSVDLTLFRVLTLAPTARDANVTAALLAQCQCECRLCASVDELAAEVRRGAGAVLLTEESLTHPRMDVLLAALDAQPSWSELPVIMLMRGGSQSRSAATALERLGNVIILDRPASKRSLISAVKAALRTRQKQYESRNQIEQIRRGEQQRAQLLENEREARQLAERASRMKDEFLATLSHELRTPLTAVLGWAQMLNRSMLTNGTVQEATAGGPDSADEADGLVRHGLEVIERNARLQSEIIEDLLDMSRIISGNVRLHMQTLQPVATLQAAVDSIRLAADAKNLTLRVHVESEISEVVGDANRLQQVFYNLLSNAVKFTPRDGTIDVHCRTVSQTVEISVRDSGMGIKREFLPFVFERFRQQDASTTRTFGGLGLGLAIVKQIVELHGGAVSAASEGEGRGATFAVALPVSTSTAPRRDEASPHVTDAPPRPATESPLIDHRNRGLLHGVRLLVVDDEPDARDLLQRILERSGAEVVLAASGAEALHVLDRERVDLVISDIGMPVMDGYAFIRKLRRRRHRQDPAIPAIALTAFARSEDSLRCVQAGFDSHLPKPVDASALLACIVELAPSGADRGADVHRRGR